MSPGVFVDIIVVLSYHIYCFIYTKEFIDFYENYMFLHCESKLHALVSIATPSFGA